MTSADELYMCRALDLAGLGQKRVAPNPLVGCVIAHDGQVISEGWHQFFGGPHAEVNAVNAVKDQSLLPKSTLYVTLEPCSHFGKTPPCADFLLRHGIRKVMICNTDPNPLVAGRGIRKLLDGGCEVHTGVLEERGLQLNRRFFTFHQRQRPYISLKWAETADGFIAKPEFRQTWITQPLARKLVHKWRTEEKAIMVGTHTARHDNPRLDARDWTGDSPLRIVIDRQLALPDDLHLFDRSIPTIVYNCQHEGKEDNLEYALLQQEEDLIVQVMDDLYRRNVQSVLIEGGTVLLQSCLRSGLWDEARVFRSAIVFGEGIKAPTLGLEKLKAQHTIGGDQLLIFQNHANL
jgi:diaminohydroxyphosphoribosylaminopyrimidine deaminase / 5-amino-6-(5-phosphoribosylamino)uracil reductase